MKVFRVRAEALQAYRQAYGLTTEQALADRIGVAQSTVNRILRGTQTPGPVFVAALVAAFHGTSIDDLFEVVDTNNTDNDKAAVS